MISKQRGTGVQKYTRSDQPVILTEVGMKEVLGLVIELRGHIRVQSPDEISTLFT